MKKKILDSNIDKLEVDIIKLINKHLGVNMLGNVLIFDKELNSEKDGFHLVFIKGKAFDDADKQEVSITTVNNNMDLDIAIQAFGRSIIKIIENEDNKIGLA